MKNLNEQIIKKAITKVLKEGVLEANRKNAIISAYNQIVSAVAGFGTDPDKVLLAIKNLKNADEYKYFLTLFRDKKTGYGDFYTMINEEYDRFNYKDIKNLMAQLNNVGVLTYANFAQNGFNQNVFSGYFRFGKFTKKEERSKINNNMAACKRDWQKELPIAVKWFKDWLSDPITKQKIKNNWDTQNKNPLVLSIYQIYNKLSVDRAYNKYFELLNNGIKLLFYNHTMTEVGGVTVSQTAGGFVTGSKPDTIFINCEYYSGRDTVWMQELLVHEIQHMLYRIKPLNPEKKIGDIYVTKNTQLETRNKIKSTINSSSSNKNQPYRKRIMEVAKKIGIEPYYLNHWEKIKKNEGFVGNPEYFCDVNEKMSNIMGIRNVLKLKPGQNITFQMIKPYLTFSKSSVDVSYLIYCWIEKDYPDINQMLNKINQLAFNQNKKSNPSGTNVA